MSEEQNIRKRRTLRTRAVPGKYKNYKKEFNKTEELVYKARNVWITIFIFIEETKIMFLTGIGKCQGCFGHQK